MEGMPEALDGMHRRLTERDSTVDPEPADMFIDEWSNLPGQLYMYNRVNPEFQPSRPANRV